MKARLLAPLLLGAAMLPAQAEDLGKLWPMCEGWDSPNGLEQTYTPADPAAHLARSAESPTWDAPHHRAEVAKFCRWLVMDYMPE